MTQNMNQTKSITAAPVRTVRSVLLPTLLSLMFVLTGHIVRPAQAQDNPSVVGQWSPVQQWPCRAIHMQMLPTGKVMFWTRYPEAIYPFLWDPVTSSLMGELPSAGWQEFCASHVLLADGQMLLMGGHVSGDGDGAPFSATFNPRTSTWAQQPNMNLGRWYPTSVILGNGDVVVVSGSYNTGYANNELPQVWSNGIWRDLTTAVRYLPLYPDLHLAPNGSVFVAGPDQTSLYLDPSGTGKWTNVADRIFPNRDYGCSVIYDDGMVFYAGGGDPPTATAEVIDLNQPAPAWRAVGSMSAPRRQMNATLLPDGNILVTGGVYGAGFNDTTTPVLSSEVWNPVTEKFTTWASMAVGRWYHSTVVLLPDARILSAGGDGNFNAEIFSPPYLFNGPRPTIKAAPDVVGYGETFAVQTPDAATIRNANWIRLSSVTHANNMDQRINRLAMVRTADGLSLTAPSNPNLCPPGYYMLFLINSKGVPSVAKIIRIGAKTPFAPLGLVGYGGNRQARLTWSQSLDATSYRVKRGTTPGGPYSTVATNVTATTFTDTGLINGRTYYYVVTAMKGNVESAPSNEAPVSPAEIGTGTGVRGQFWDNLGFKGKTLTRIYPEINFNWGNGAPIPAMGVDTFSARWTGQVQPRYSETYTFTTTSDDGVRLWVNGQLLIDNWTDHAPTADSGNITLVAGQKYDIRMEYYENGGGAVAKLEWQSVREPRQVVPKAQLYPPRAVSQPILDRVGSVGSVGKRGTSLVARQRLQ